MKRPKAFGLRTFCDPRCPVDHAGAFRDNIRVFLQECGDVQEYSVRGTPVWCTLLVDEKSGVVVPMYTVEEVAGCSPRPSCEFCRCSGWSHHFVTKRRYHFIIPSDDDWEEPLDQDALDLQTHLLHGLIHCNGFGHLLLINGRDGGSKHISGRDIMNLWDRICSSLHTRQVTVDDTSRKNSMDLKLLLGVGYGITWFGRWGYIFHLGSFGVKEEAFFKAIDLIASQDLNGLIDDFEMVGRERELKRIASTYLSKAQNPRLNTVRDLVHSLLLLQSEKRTHPVQKPDGLKPRKTGNSSCSRKRYRDFEDVAAELDSRWPVRRLRGAAEVVVDALLDNGGLMTRQELRDASRKTIGDTGLLDFVLKSLGDCVIGIHIVRRTHNTSTRVLEFTIENADANDVDESATVVRKPVVCQQQQVEKDMLWVYKNILLRGKAAETVLHGKHWIKSWPLRDEEDDQLRFFCRWMPSESEIMLGELTRPLPPPEVTVMAPHASVVDLRNAAESAMRDTYCIMEGFVATRVEGVEGEEWDPLFGSVESGATVWVRGVGVDLGGGERRNMRYEGGADNWTVECGCGATDDDGERMVACDICEVWQHTWCAGIDDGDDVPRMFLCGRCAGTVMGHQYEAIDMFDSKAMDG